MATVKIITPRQQAAHFGLYRTSAGGDESIIVRRKIGEPTDYMHTTSKKLRRQREALGQAATHYSHLTSLQKEDLKHHIEEVEYIKNHGKTDIKVLQGRALFISKEIHNITELAKQIEMPFAICIVSAEPTGTQIGIDLTLKKTRPYPVITFPAFYPYPGTNIFYPVPRLEATYYTGSYYPRLATAAPRLYSYDELRKGVIQLLYPYFYENSLGPYCRPTCYINLNWRWRTPDAPNQLFLVDVHEHDGTGWYNYRPYPMATFRISYFGEHTIAVNIDPHHFTYPNVISKWLGDELPFWRVNIDPETGGWSLDPPQKNCVYDYVKNKVILHY